MATEGEIRFLTLTNNTMADEDNNRFESNPTWIRWKGLNKKGSLEYCQKVYLKPRDEEDLKKKTKAKIKQSDERKQKRLLVADPKRSQVEYSDGIKRVANPPKWIEWTNMESGKLEYKGRIFNKEVSKHELQLMRRIINTIDYNQSAHEGEIEDAIIRKKRREVAKAMVEMGRGGGERNNGEIKTSNDGEADNTHGCRGWGKGSSGRNMYCPKQRCH